MDKKYKIILVVLVILLIVIGAYVLMCYKNEMDNREFKEVLKNVSDIENITDKNYASVYSGKSISIDDYIIFSQSDSDNASKEIKLLKEFKNKTFNQTQKDFLELQINRLEKEKLSHEKDVDLGNQCKRYYNGEITASKYSDLQKTNAEERDKINSEVSKIKDETIIYLDNYRELKAILEEIDVDEDFYINEKGGTTGNGRVYFTK